MRDILVVKIGGSLSYYDLSGLYADVGELDDVNNIVIVHGGGRRVSERVKKLGLKPELEYIVSPPPNSVRGRHTTKEVMRVFVEVMEEENRRHVDALRKQGVDATGFYGSETPFHGSRKRPIHYDENTGKRRRILDDYSGKIEKVDAERLLASLKRGEVPVIAPLVIGTENGEEILMNTDGDKGAAYCVGAIRAKWMVDLTDVDGLLVRDSGKERLVYSIPEFEIEGWIQSMYVKAGMKRKLMSAKLAFTFSHYLDFELKEVIISNGRRERPISSALAHESCTVIY